MKETKRLLKKIKINNKSCTNSYVYDTIESKVEPIANALGLDKVQICNTLFFNKGVFRKEGTGWVSTAYRNNTDRLTLLNGDDILRDAKKLIKQSIQFITSIRKTILEVNTNHRFTIHFGTMEEVSGYRFSNKKILTKARLIGKASSFCYKQYRSQTSHSKLFDISKIVNENTGETVFENTFFD